jgi:hypothetical protein
MALVTIAHEGTDRREAAGYVAPTMARCRAEGFGIGGKSGKVRRTATEQRLLNDFMLTIAES